MKAVVLFSFAFPQCLWYTRARRHESGIFFSARAGGGRPGAGSAGCGQGKEAQPCGTFRQSIENVFEHVMVGWY